MQTSSRLQIDFFSFIHELLSSWSRIAQGQSERWIRLMISVSRRGKNRPGRGEGVTSKWSLIATRTGHTSKQYWSEQWPVLIDFLP